ncbi:hypothetical protein A0257_13420 [Hymenobacter psoromatis]|nr:hypothetical protein A0257_13420 [Hymenobacter psoromatis]
MKAYYWLPLFLVLLAGCEVPDVQPFADATSSMGQAINTSLQQVSSDFKRLDLLTPQQLTTTEHDTLVKFQKRLATATKAFGAVPPALDAYAASLVAITDARVKGDKRIEAVTSAIGKLAVAAGPWGQAVGLGAEPVAAILKDLGGIRTLHTLTAKVAAQDSAIQRIARYLAKGIRLFGVIDAKAVGLYENSLTRQYYPVKKYYAAALVIQNQAINVLENMAELNAARSLLATPDRAGGAEKDIASSAKELARLDPELARAYRKQPPLTARETRAAQAYYQVLDTRAAYYKTRLIDPQTLALYQDAEQHLAAYYTEQERNQQLLSKCAGLIGSWAQSHRALHISLNQARHHLMTQELFDQAQDIKKATDNIRALKL